MYLSNLREKLIECIHIIFIVIKENNKSEDFKPFVTKIINFINNVNMIELNGSIVIIIFIIFVLFYFTLIISIEYIKRFFGDYI